MGIQINGQTDTVTSTDGSINVGGNVTIPGVLTYEDVTSIDAVGIITANAGIQLDDSITHLGDTDTKIRFPANNIFSVETGGAERLRIGTGGKLHLGDRSYANNNTYFGTSLVNICGPDNPPTSLTRAGSYLDIGGTESLVNSMLYISFGHATTQTYKPAFIGYKTTNAGAAECGDLFFATRSVITDTEPTERLRITSGGGHKIKCNESWTAANLSECNTDKLALNINQTRQGETKAIAFGAIGSSAATSIQCYDTSNNSANNLLLNPFGGNLGIGVDNPVGKLEVAGDAVISHTGANPLDLYKYGTAAPTILMYGANGTAASPTQTLTGDVIGGFNAFGYGSSGFAGGPSVRITAVATENNGQTSNRGADIKIETVTTGGTSLGERLRITAAGLMGLGASNPGDYDGEANDFVVRSGNHTGITIASSGSNQRCNLYFSDGTSGSEKYRGAFTYDHSDDSMMMRIGAVERLRIDSSGLIGNNGRAPSNYGSPNLLLSGTDSTLTLMGDGSTNNSSYAGIKFRVAGASAGDYTKAGIFVQRQDSYNDLDMIFAFRSTNDAAGVAISDEKVRINSDGAVTKPYQPAFIARYSVNDTTWNVATDGWAKILFDEEMMDKGGNYSTTNSEFTAPVTGTYLFGAELQLEAPNGISSGYLTSGSNWMYISFIVNGATTLDESKGGTRTDANFNARYNSYTPTHLLNLTAGDRVSLYRTGNYTSIKFKGGIESAFWGYLVA